MRGETKLERVEIRAPLRDVVTVASGTLLERNVQLSLEWRTRVVHDGASLLTFGYLLVYPTEQQTAERQSKDESDCYSDCAQRDGKLASAHARSARMCALRL